RKLILGEHDASAAPERQAQGHRVQPLSRAAHEVHAVRLHAQETRELGACRIRLRTPALPAVDAFDLVSVVELRRRRALPAPGEPGACRIQIRTLRQVWERRAYLVHG